MRYAVHRKDGCQDGIVAGLERVGVKVHILSGKDTPDLLVAHRGVFSLFELKDGARQPSQRKLRPGQQKFAEKFAGYPVYKIESLDQAFATLGIKVA